MVRHMQDKLPILWTMALAWYKIIFLTFIVVKCSLSIFKLLTFVFLKFICLVYLKFTFMRPD